MLKPLNWDSFFVKWGCYSRQCDTHENQDTWIVCHYISNTNNTQTSNGNITPCCNGVRLDNLCSFPSSISENFSLQNFNLIKLSHEDAIFTRRKATACAFI
jgi:hypothetical protein